MKIRTALIIITLVLLVITTSVFNVVLGIQLGSSADAMFDTYLKDVSQMQAANLKGYLTDTQSRFDSIISIPVVQKFTMFEYEEGTDVYRETESTLDALVASGAVAKIVIYKDDNSVILQSGADDTITDASGICTTNITDRVIVVNTAENDSQASDYTLSMRAKVNEYNVGIVFAKTSIQSIIERSKGLIFLVDPYGAIVTSQDFVGDIASGTAQYAPYYNAVAEATETPALFKNNNTVAYVTRSLDGWVVVSNQQLSKATEFSSSTSATVTAISVVLLVVAAVAGIILIISVTKPFYQIQETLLKISRGDHDARVEIMAKNEYGDIARVFNDIVDEIIVSETRYRTIIEMSDNIIFEWNLNNNEVSFSNNFNKKFSYRAPSDHYADSFLLKCKVHPDDNDRYKSDLEKLPKGENFKHNEYRLKNIYGDYIWVLIRTATIVDKDNKPVKIVGVIVDIDRAKKSENILTARASFDSLTGVYNRETIESAINNEIEFIAARKTEFAILFVDIDDFKIYNDRYSHATGDQVLRFTATTIKNAVGESGMVGRYGGDEFIVCLKNADDNDPALIAEQILNTLKDGFECDSGDRLSINVSIGISIIKDNTRRVDEIIGMADDAMYKIKKSGKSNFGFLDS